MPALDAYAQPLDAGQQVEQDAYQQQLYDVATKRKAQQLALQDQQTQADQLAQSAKIKSQMPIAGVDMMQWGAHPDYHGKSWDELPPEAQSHFTDQGVYDPSIAVNAPTTWNQSQRDATGNPLIGSENAPPNAQVSTEVAGNKMTIARAPKLPSDIESEAVRLGIDPTGKTVGQIEQERDAKLLETGVIPEKIRPIAEKLAGSIQHNPILSAYAKQKQAFDTLKSGFEDPTAGGFSDMAMIEGFQRIVNPGAVVRQGTMDNMKSAVGWLSKLDPSFQWNKATVGESLTQPARQRLMQLAQADFQKSTASATRELAGKRILARQYGVPEAQIEPFINNTLNYVAASADEAPTTPPAATPSAPATAVGGKPQFVRQNGVTYQLQGDGSYK